MHACNAWAVSLAQAIPLLASVCTLLAFFLIVFGIAALVIFRNVHHNACVDEDGGYEPVLSGYDGSYGCGRSLPARQCPAEYKCQVRRGTAGAICTVLGAISNIVDGLMSGMLILHLQS